jgi:hypothetical protein
MVAITAGSVLDSIGTAPYCLDRRTALRGAPSRQREWSLETLVSLPADAALTKPQERGANSGSRRSSSQLQGRSLLQDPREVRADVEEENVTAESDRPLRPLLPGGRPPGWVAIVVAFVLVGAVCWLAYNTDATRIEVPGVITWERAREGDDPGTSRQSRRPPADPPECTTSGPNAGPSRATGASAVRACDDLLDPEADGS